MDLRENPLAARLVDHFKGRAETARQFNRSTEAIRLWLKDGIPLSQAIEVEEISGGVVTAEEILVDAKRTAERTPETRAT